MALDLVEGRFQRYPRLRLGPVALLLVFNTRMTELESISTRRLSDKGLKSGAFDAIDRTILHTAGATYGVTDDFEIGVSLGWFESINFREAELEIEDGEEGEVEVLKANPDGLTDTWLTGKYRFLRGPKGALCISLRS